MFDDNASSAGCQEGINGEPAATERQRGEKVKKVKR
jgi:hypothetical protein